MREIGPISEQDRAKFWNKVNRGRDGECWPWLGCMSHGYGVFNYAYNNHAQAHRVAYWLAKGDIPKGLIVRHTCDNPACCNPSHLLVGTIKDNSYDMSTRGRSMRAFRGAHAKLTWTQVDELRAMYKTGNFTQKRLGEIFGMSQRGVCNILLEISWKIKDRHHTDK